MKKLFVYFIAAMFVFVPMAYAGSVSPGPAPNSGDGVSDGSGLTHPDSPGQGPAPNSGDGISDGSGFPDEFPAELFF